MNPVIAALKVIDRICRALAILAGAALLFVMGSLCADVALRTFTGDGLPQVVEYAEVLLVVLVFLAWSETQRRRGHVAIELIVARLPARVQEVVILLGLVVVFAVLVPVTWHTGVDAWESYQRGEFRVGISHTQIWPARAAISVGLLALMLQIAAQTLTSIDRFRRGVSVGDPAPTGGTAQL